MKGEEVPVQVLRLLVLERRTEKIIGRRGPEVAAVS